MTQPLVSTDWAEKHLHDDDVVVVEVDEDASAYHDSHIPGAVAFDWRADLQDALRRTFVGKEDFEALLDSRGITNDTHVLLYGGNNNWFAASAYWYFKLYGHEKVSLIDGGRLAWEVEGRPLTSDATDRPATSGYRASDPDPALRVRRDEVLERFVGAPDGTALVDVRSPAEFSGESVTPDHLPNEGAQVPGHIPGAANVPWSKAVDAETGRFLPVETLRGLYADVGISPDKEVATYCRIGERSAHTWFVLHELLGYEQVRNYDGSWTEYGSLVDVPVARGA